MHALKLLAVVAIAVSPCAIAAPVDFSTYYEHLADYPATVPTLSPDGMAVLLDPWPTHQMLVVRLDSSREGLLCTPLNRTSAAWNEDGSLAAWNAMLDERTQMDGVPLGHYRPSGEVPVESAPIARTAELTLAAPEVARVTNGPAQEIRFEDYAGNRVWPGFQYPSRFRGLRMISGEDLIDITQTPSEDTGRFGYDDRQGIVWYRSNGLNIVDVNTGERWLLPLHVNETGYHYDYHLVPGSRLLVVELQTLDPPPGAAVVKEFFLEDFDGNIIGDIPASCPFPADVQVSEDLLVFRDPEYGTRVFRMVRPEE